MSELICLLPRCRARCVKTYSDSSMKVLHPTPFRSLTPCGRRETARGKPGGERARAPRVARLAIE